MHFSATTWAGFSYKWTSPTTHARVERSRRGELLDRPAHRDWHFPSRNDCMTCHIPDKGYAVLGPETAQMNGSSADPNQLDKLQTMGVFDAPIPMPYKPR